MDAPRTAPLWRIAASWFLLALLGLILIHNLIEGDVVCGKSVKVHYTRSRDPIAYWLSIAVHALLLGVFIYFQLKTMPEPGESPKRDLTPRDWMGNPIDRK